MIAAATLPAQIIPVIIIKHQWIECDYFGVNGFFVAAGNLCYTLGERGIDFALAKLSHHNTCNKQVGFFVEYPDGKWIIEWGTAIFAIAIYLECNAVFIITDTLQVKYTSYYMRSFSCKGKAYTVKKYGKVFQSVPIIEV